MLEPPSPKLVQLLVGLKLCTAADLKRCRGRVRRLARDLPAFDSVWIDALLQARRLTPFQARLLDTQSESLAVGPCVLVDRLGQGRHAATFVARPREGHELCVLKRIDVPPEALTLGLIGLEQLTARLERFAHPSIAAPHTSLRHGGQLVTVSRYVPGLHLAELLVRRGRFPASVVLGVAQQLTDGLAALEERGVAHGDIGLRNVRLTAGGVAVLVDAGTGAVLFPELTIHPATPPDRYEGIAPERIGTGQAPNSVSDLYALGCLLWQLLAGRPPFPTGDPLAKLAAHQTRTIDDVRTWAPDTPPALADMIGRLTAADPVRRPASFREVRSALGPPRRAARRRLARFRRCFESSVRHTAGDPTAPSAMKIPLLLALLAAAALGGASAWHPGTRATLLNIAARVSQTTRDLVARAATEPKSPIEPTTAAESSKLLPLPPPDAQNVILLTERGPYQAGPISSVGPVTLRAAGGVRPEIVVRDQPCRIVATQVALENVTFRLAAMESGVIGAGALLLVRSDSLTMRGCRFDLTADSAPQGDLQSHAVGWTALDPSGRNGDVTLSDCVVHGDGAAVFLRSLPTAVQMANCLKTAGGPLLTCAKLPAAGHDLRVALDHVTLREASALLRGAVSDGRPGRITLAATGCVFDLSGPGAALLQILAPSNRTDWPATVEITGIGSLAPQGLPVARQMDAATGAAVAVDPAAVFVEGISTAAYRFAGPLTARPANSALAEHHLPTRSPQPPGINAAALDKLILPK